MEVYFGNTELDVLYHKGKSNKYKKISKNKDLLEGYVKAVNALKNAENINTIKQLSFLHYEKLKYNELSSIRILNGSIERLLFREEDNKIEITLIEINLTHYGNK